jgi:pilus assembly protein CpaF
VNAIIPPLSLIGPILTIRRFAGQRYSMPRLVDIGALTAPMAEFLKICVQYRKNIIVSGGTGTGKTTFLNALSEYIANTERIVTIEDAAELRLVQPHVLSLEARPPNVEGRGEVTIRDLVRNALRMRPDRIIVGECRGGEALDMLQAMNTGHDGSLSTVHANTPRDAIARLETMVLMAGLDLPSRAIREQIASAIDLVVQIARLRDGSRRITHVTEVVGMEGDTISLQDIFEFDYGDAKETGGKLTGELRPTGIRPMFSTRLADRGIPLPAALFGVPDLDFMSAGGRR